MEMRPLLSVLPLEAPYLQPVPAGLALDEASGSSLNWRLRGICRDPVRAPGTSELLHNSAGVTRQRPVVRAGSHSEILSFLLSGWFRRVPGCGYL